MARIWQHPFNAKEYGVIEESLQEKLMNAPDEEVEKLLEKVQREKETEEYYDRLYQKGSSV